MCVEIVMMILMMISAKEKRYTTCVGAHKVTKRVRKEKNLSSLCPLPHETTSNQHWRRPKKKRVKEKKGKKRKGNTVVLHVWVEGVGFKNQK